MRTRKRRFWSMLLSLLMLCSLTQGAFAGTFNNEGKLINNGGATFTNTGAFNNGAQGVVQNDGSFSIETGGTFANSNTTATSPFTGNKKPVNKAGAAALSGVAETLFDAEESGGGSTTGGAFAARWSRDTSNGLNLLAWDAPTTVSGVQAYRVKATTATGVTKELLIATGEPFASLYDELDLLPSGRNTITVEALDKNPNGTMDGAQVLAISNSLTLVLSVNSAVVSYSATMDHSTSEITVTPAAPTGMTPTVLFTSICDETGGYLSRIPQQWRAGMTSYTTSGPQLTDGSTLDVRLVADSISGDTWTAEITAASVATYNAATGKFTGSTVSPAYTVKLATAYTNFYLANTKKNGSTVLPDGSDESEMRYNAVAGDTFTFDLCADTTHVFGDDMELDEPAAGASSFRYNTKATGHKTNTVSFTVTGDVDLTGMTVTSPVYTLWSSGQIPDYAAVNGEVTLPTQETVFSNLLVLSEGTLNVTGAGCTLNIQNCTNEGEIKVYQSGAMTNSGTLNNGGTITIDSNCAMDNTNGTLNNGGGSITGDGELINYTLAAAKTGTILPENSNNKEVRFWLYGIGVEVTTYYDSNFFVEPADYWTVTLDAGNKGTFEDNATTKTIYVEKGQSLSLNSIERPKTADGVFSGWQDSEGKALDDDALLTETDYSGKTLYAR